jgi:hypothetical protein
MRRGAMMEFRITEAEAREMARLEEECGCDINAGSDWGIHLDKVMELALHPIDSAEPTLCDRSKSIDVKYELESQSSIAKPET